MGAGARWGPIDPGVVYTTLPALVEIAQARFYAAEAKSGDRVMRSPDEFLFGLKAIAFSQYQYLATTMPGEKR